MNWRLQNLQINCFLGLDEPFCRLTTLVDEGIEVFVDDETVLGLVEVWYIEFIIKLG